MSWRDSVEQKGVLEAISAYGFGMSFPEIVSMDDLSYEAIEDYRSTFAEVNPNHPWVRLSMDDFLMRINAAYRSSMTRELYPTKDGLLMFGYEYAIVRIFPEYELDYRKVLKNKHISKRIVSNDGKWSGCVYDFWRKVITILTDEYIGVDNNQDDLIFALKEGLVNSLVHADYCGRRHVVVIEEADRFEFSNPGTLRISPNTAFKNTTSDPKNPILMKMFALIGACHDLGIGLCKVWDICQKSNLADPVITHSTSPDRTSLTIFISDYSQRKTERLSPSNEETNISHRTSVKRYTNTTAEGISPLSSDSSNNLRNQLIEPSSVVNDAISRARNDDCKEALQLFYTKGRIRRTDVQSVLGMGSTKAKEVISHLVTDGLIRREGGGRSTYYKLNRT